jgi:hypothetical protein
MTSASTIARTTGASLDDWPATAKVGYVVRDGDGAERRIAVTTDGRVHVEGGDSFAIVEEIRVLERRAGLRAMGSGRI